VFDRNVSEQHKFSPEIAGNAPYALVQAHGKARQPVDGLQINLLDW
jgi:hypothetical protein